MAVSFDLDRLKPKGQPYAVLADVMQALNDSNNRLNTGAGQYAVSASGSLVYVPGGTVPKPGESLVRVDQNGNITPVGDFKDEIAYPRFSPEGQRIAYSNTYSGENAVIVYDLNRDVRSKLTGDGRMATFAWVPDRRTLVFGWFESGPANLYQQPVDGSSPKERLTNSKNHQRVGSFNYDGSILAFVETRRGQPDILLLDMKSRRVTPFLESKAYEGWPEISPDGRWLAYASDEKTSGRPEVRVRPLLGGGMWQISREGGTEPIWSKDGKQLFYRTADQVWVVDIQTERGFNAGKPLPLFKQSGLKFGGPIRCWDLWPDGKSFLMVKLDERKPQPVTEMILVQNWLEELKSLVPTGK